MQVRHQRHLCVPSQKKKPSPVCSIIIRTHSLILGKLLGKAFFMGNKIVFSLEGPFYMMAYVANLVYL